VRKRGRKNALRRPIRGKKNGNGVFVLMDGRRTWSVGCFLKNRTKKDLATTKRRVEKKKKKERKGCSRKKEGKKGKGARECTGEKGEKKQGGWPTKRREKGPGQEKKGCR